MEILILGETEGLADTLTDGEADMLWLGLAETDALMLAQ
jgi:hypothetical protein